MEYTVQALAKLSGVSIRTLRYYDTIGLLKPAYVAENGYRYYRDEQLLRLQQILFFKEFGFELKRIRQIMGQSDFDTIKTLQEHKKVLRAHINRLRALIQTIDKTVDHLEGKQVMKETEIYYGFSKEKQAEYEQQLIKKFGSDRKEFAECKERLEGWDQADWHKGLAMFEELHKAFAKAIEDGRAPQDPEVQKLVKKHFDLISLFWTPTKETYIGLGKMYVEHPDFNKVYAAYHPELARFMATAMNYFAEMNI